MKKGFLLWMILPLLFGCSSNTHELDLKAFKITIPNDWKYIKLQGEDSFVGDIKTPKGKLSFDVSKMGYANHLVASESEFLASGDWVPVTALQRGERKVRVLTGAEKQKYPDADYIGELYYKDSIGIVPIVIPQAIRGYYFKVDTTDKYIIKTLWPKVPGSGITGIYFKARKGSFNFNLMGDGLPEAEQQQALAAFKTIKITE